MAEDLIFTRKEAAFLRELVKRRVPFMIVGLASAALQGAPAVTQDVDLWFRDVSDPRIREALDKVGAAYVPPVGLNPPMFAGEAVDLFNIVLRMDGLETFDEEARSAVEVSLRGVSVKLLPIDRIIASKKAANRPKDKLSLPFLENAGIAIRAKRVKKKAVRRAPRRRP